MTVLRATGWSFLGIVVLVLLCRLGYLAVVGGVFSFFLPGF